MLTWVPEWGRYFLLARPGDDAAGEAFDKVGKLLGPLLSGRAGRSRRPRLAAIPGGTPSPGLLQPPRASRAHAGPRFDFSFSGLKTAVVRAVSRLEGDAARRTTPQTGKSATGERAHLAASFQEAAVDRAGPQDLWTPWTRWGAGAS